MIGHEGIQSDFKLTNCWGNVASLPSLGAKFMGFVLMAVWCQPQVSQQKSL